jgi:8-oxo-dGTP pyrophosphatase MutT (NUDIX family)
MSGPDDAPPAANGDARVPEPWLRLASEPGEDMLLFRPRWDTLVNPRTSQPMRRLVLEVRDWVNVVALTPERHMVLVRQFRFGTNAMSLEIPGGVVDRGEAHGDAARRELREETGYTSERWTYLGAVEPNPAFQDNLCHHWLARDARATHPQELDGGEDIAIVTMPEEEVLSAVRAGTIRHSLVLTALSHVYDLRTER